MTRKSYYRPKHGKSAARSSIGIQMKWRPENRACTEFHWLLEDTDLKLRLSLGTQKSTVPVQ